ncbi:nucleoside monophosphate kinase [Pseudomonas sp. HR96]|uniref:nucleoside monophosphate kinase n=1 Tax=Pseudomonas sp. HR96 TaxID=1027966 RepID=UPI002A75AB83|nr:nucleoside monophosphate kinase [Pseudomonas sp. HR96]WPO98318.1 nucleoside monophosphate kinase [Pseudomonas sp. HR96]
MHSKPPSNVDIESRLVIPRAEIRGKGAFILTGPSSCGKGELAQALCDALSIPQERWLSMGNILRHSFEHAKEYPEFAATLQSKYGISDATPIIECEDATEELVAKVSSHQEALEGFLKDRRPAGATDIWRTTSQLEWLEYCTINGLLVPNRWTQALIEAHIELFATEVDQPFIVDGYPRTKAAAMHLLQVFERNEIPVLKVLHLSISKQQMLRRAGKRQRMDDNNQALLKRYEFYVESVQPSVDYLKDQVGSDKVALIDAHQPHYDIVGEDKVFNLDRSINNVVYAALISIGLSNVLARALVASRQN